jgi:hypothetical protein
MNKTLIERVDAENVTKKVAPARFKKGEMVGVMIAGKLYVGQYFEVNNYGDADECWVAFPSTAGSVRLGLQDVSIKESRLIAIKAPTKKKSKSK